MNRISALAYNKVLSFQTIFSAIFLLMILATNPLAQNATSATDGSTPLGLAPGAPAGSYALSGFENVNLYNGGLNFSLPLLHIGGRGETQTTITLPIEQKWRVEKRKGPAGPNGQPTTLSVPMPNWWLPFQLSYRPGALAARHFVAGECSQENPAPSVETLTRLTFTASDGTEFELRDQATGGARQNSPSGCNSGNPNPLQGASRGAIFTTADGAFATFISDSIIYDRTQSGRFSLQSFPSGLLMMRDGTRYRIDEGLVTSIRDRNGNIINFGYDTFHRVVAVTDSLKRKVGISYDQNAAACGRCDEIRYNGFGGAERVIRVSKTSLANALRNTHGSDITTTQTFKALFPGLQGSNTDKYEDTRVSAVYLPDGRSFRFFYNVYGELARIELPTGGAFEYDWDFALPADLGGEIYRRIIERRVYNGGNALENRTLFKANFSKVADPQPYTTTVRVDQVDGSGQLLGRQKHHFYGSVAVSLFKIEDYPVWTEGREYRTESFDKDGATVLTRVENTFQQRAHIGWWTEGDALEPPNDVRLIQTITTLPQTNQSAKKTYQYGDYNNITSTQEFGFDGRLVRETRASYLTTNPAVSNSLDYAANTDIHIRNLPNKVETLDGNGAIIARTTYEYDGYSEPLLDRAAIVKHDSAFDSSYKTRGNVTLTTQDVFPTGDAVTTRRIYDIAGNVIAVIDPRGNRTDFDFSDNFGAPDEGVIQPSISPPQLGGGATYAFVTTATNPLGHTTRTKYDYELGKPVKVEDANGQVSSVFYSDALDRPTLINESGLRQTQFTYNDANHLVATSSDQVTLGDAKRKTEAVYDGLGRTVSTRRYESAGNFILAETKYDGLGRPAQTSNPYRPGDGVLWTTTEYDGLSRVIAVTTPDGAKIKTDYFGPQTTVTDQAGKTRRSRTDSLGRLVEVVEDPLGLAYQTTYAYDALDNLRQVVQGGQTRSFSYDSLKRLISATNPESGTVVYSYDANSNLISKRDARSVSTSYQYDALNRLTIRSYNDGTPQVSQSYDAPAVANSKGRLTSISSPVSASYFDEYDALGRAKRRRQVTDGQTYAMSYEYDLARNLTKQTYPSGRVITTSYDDLNRVNSVSGQKGGEAGKTYASSFTYAAHSGLKSVMLGNGLWERINYNLRLQAEEIGLGTSSLDSDVLRLSYSYGGVNNNGNALGQTITGPGLNLTQAYSYDGLNRLSQAKEAIGRTEQWRQTYDYDRYGNRAVRSESLIPTPALTPQSLSAFSPATNRITLPGFAYDASGNLVSDPATGNGASAIIYDAENRMTSVTKNGATTTYVYDGEGHRVKKTTGGAGTVYVYNIADQLIAEYDSAAGQAGAVATSYLTTDHLGSTRVVTDGSGMVKARYDYLPFGEEIFNSIGGRAAVAGYNANSGVRQKFGSKERDNETGLDFFEARYFASAQGRFTSPDPLYYTVERPGDPQRFNLYAYVRNNPLVFTDPDGKDIVVDNKQDIGQVRRDLNRLAPGTAVDNNGVVHKPSFFRQIWNHLTGHGKGASLVGRLVDSRQTTHIQLAPGTNNGTATPTDFGAVQQGQASDVVVTYDPNITIGLPTRARDANGKVTSSSPIQDEVPSAALVLGHELSHADHLTRGGVNLGMDDHDFVEGNIVYSEHWVSEEFRTVGFSGFVSRRDITENQLRRELGTKPRAAYRFRVDWQQVNP